MIKFDPHLFFNPVSKKNFDPPTSSLNPHLKKISTPTSFWTIRTLARLIGWRPVLAKSPLRHGYLQDLIRVMLPPSNLLHPGREATVGPRLLIRRKTTAYLAAGL